MAKVEGDGHDKAVEVDEELEDDGLMAYFRLTKWCAKIGGEGLTQKRNYVTAPRPPKCTKKGPK